jgi:hypothetical protein
MSKANAGKSVVINLDDDDEDDDCVIVQEHLSQDRPASERKTSSSAATTALGGPMVPRSEQQQLVAKALELMIMEGFPGQLTISKRGEETMEEFLSRGSPSQHEQGEVSWIYVTDETRDRQPYVDAKATAWFQALEEKKSELVAQKDLKGKEKTARYAAFRASVLGAAKQNGAGVGKWLLNVEPKHADAVWALIAQWTVSGLLGSSAKVSPLKGSTQHHGIICVYCERFWAVDDCLRVMDKMLEGAEGKELASKAFVVGFKPDIFTHIGIAGDFGGRTFRKTLTKGDASDPTLVQDKWEAGKVRWNNVKEGQEDKPAGSGVPENKRKRGEEEEEEADPGGGPGAGHLGAAPGSAGGGRVEDAADSGGGRVGSGGDSAGEGARDAATGKSAEIRRSAYDVKCLEVFGCNLKLLLRILVKDDEGACERVLGCTWDELLAQGARSKDEEDIEVIHKMVKRVVVATKP